MTYSIEKLSGGVKIKFDLPQDEWDKFIDRAYHQQKHEISIPGFRKGHAPRRLIEQKYGKGIFFDDAFNICYRESYSKVLDENQDIYPVEEPKIDIEKIDQNGITFTAEFAVKPEAKLGQYKGLKITKVKYEVTQDDIDAEINAAKERLVRKVEKDDDVADGDIVNLNYSGSIDGEKFDGGTAEDQELVIGSNTFIPGFETQLIGFKKGENKDITVTFPEDYHAQDLKGKEAVFNITINNIYTKEYPEINDDFAKEVSRFETLKEYKEDIEKRLKESNEQREKRENENSLIEKIVENTSVEIPQAMIDTEINYMLSDLAYRLMYMYNGMKLEDYFKYTGTSMEQYRAANQEQAERNVKTRLAMEEIIKAEKLEVLEEDYQKELEKLAENAKKTVDEYKKTMDQNQENYIRNNILSNKLLEFLVSNNEFVDEATK